MDDWAWEQLQQWLDVRVELPVGPLLCVLTGPTRGRAWSQAFRNLTNYIARSLLETGGFRARLHPAL